jgi:5-methylcytosine-specific restriction protein A
MVARRCLDCGVIHRNPSRCDRCESAANIRRGSSTQRGYGSDWRALRRRVLDAWTASYGAVCPGWNRPSHAAERLTVDHVQPKAKGGTNDLSNLSVLCTSCNSAKRDTLRYQ